VQVNRVGAWLACASAAGTGEVVGVNPQAGQDLRSDADAEFSVLSAFGLVSWIPVVVNADKKGSSQKVNSLLTGCFAMTSGRRGWLRLASQRGRYGCGGQTFPPAPVG